MERLIPRIKQIADRIYVAESKRKKMADFLVRIKEDLEISKRISENLLEKMKVVGIDGGITRKSLHGFDCVLVKSAGACFSYKKGKIEKVEYYPSRIPYPEPEITEALTDIDWAYFTSTMRLNSEVTTAIKAMEKFSPDLILMDGSIVPHYADRPPKDSFAHENYSDVVEKYRELYTKAIETKTRLAGIIEDSRGISFCKIINNEILSRINHQMVPELEQILMSTRDTNILYWVLEKGERSRVFKYSDAPDEHVVLKDLGEMGRAINSFYLKTARFDRPIRIDFLKDKSTENEIADWVSSVLLAISGHHSGYGLPAPIIEADNIAKISEGEMENFYSQILTFTGNLPGVMKLRRDQRPF